MSRTICDIPVVGRNYADVRFVIQQWMTAQGLGLKQESPGLVVANEGSMMLFGEKVFCISIVPQPWGVHVHTEGYMPEWTGGEMDFDPGSFYGGIPRRAGYKKLSDLWARLRGLSVPGIPVPVAAITGTPPTALRAQACVKCGGVTEHIPAYGRWYCRKCGIYV